jgi:CheY-like chemotaxis protein
MQPDKRVIYYSAYASEAEQKAALSVCGDAYLKKPVSPEYLEQTIAKLLHRKSKL